MLRFHKCLSTTLAGDITLSLVLDIMELGKETQCRAARGRGRGRSVAQYNGLHSGAVMGIKSGRHRRRRYLGFITFLPLNMSLTFCKRP